MADTSMRTLLLRLGVSTDDFKKAAAEIRAKLVQLQDQQKQQAQEAQNKQRQMAAEAKRAAAEAGAAQKKAMAEAAQGAKEYASKLQQLKLDAISAAEARKQKEAEVKQQIAGQNAELQKQIQLEKVAQAQLRTELQKQRAEMSKGRHEEIRRGGEGGGGGGFFGAVARGIPFVGQLMAGVAGGEMLGRMVERIGEKTSELLFHPLETTENVGLTQERREEAAEEVEQRLVLNRMLAGTGLSLESFEDELRKSTMGLVDSTTLLTTANAAFRSGAKLKPSQVNQAMGDVTKLALLAHGPGGVGMSMQALQTAITSGYGRQLAQVLQLPSVYFRMSMGTAGGPGGRSFEEQQNVTNLLNALHVFAKALPAPVKTFSIAMRQWETAVHDFHIQVARLIESSPALVTMMTHIASAFQNLNEVMDRPAVWEKLQDALNDVFTTVAKVGAGLLGVVQSLLPVASFMLNMGSGGAKAALWVQKKYLQNQLAGEESMAKTPLTPGLGVTPAEAQQANALTKARITQLQGELANINIQFEALDSALKLVKGQGIEVFQRGLEKGQQALLGFVTATNETIRQGREPAQKYLTETVGTATKAGAQLKELERVFPGLRGTSPSDIAAYTALIAASMHKTPGALTRADVESYTETKWTPPQPPDFEVTREKAQTAEKHQESTAQTGLVKTQAEIKRKEALLDESRSRGLVSNQQYYEQLDALQKASSNAQIAEAKRVAALQIALQRDLLQKGVIASQQATQKIGEINDGLNKQLAQMDEQQETQHLQTMLRQADAVRQLATIQVQETQRVATERISQEKQVASASYQLGKTSLDEYYAAQKTTLQKEIDVENVAYAARKKIGVGPPAAQAQFEAQHQEKMVGFQRQQTSLSLREAQARIQMQRQEEEYQVRQAQRSVQQRQLQIQMGAAMTGTQLSPETMQAMMAPEYAKQVQTLEKVIQKEQTRLSQMDRQSEAYIRLSQTVAGFQEQLQRAQDTLERSRGSQNWLGTQLQMTGSLGTAAGILSPAISQMGRFGSAVSQYVPQLAQMNAMQQQGISFNLFGGLVAGAKALFTQPANVPQLGSLPSGGVGGMFQTGQQKQEQSVDKFAKSVQTFASAANIFTQMAQGKLGPGAGTLAGATAGMGLGQGLGGAVGGTLGSLMGPIGAAVGSVAGLISGIMTQATEQMAHNIDVAFQETMFHYQSGLLSLSQTIKSAQQAESKAIAQLSNAKGGRQELDALLPQFEQTIAQLTSQQKQIFSSFGETTMIQQLPLQLQDTATSVQNLVQQWYQYIEAGGNVATANQYLSTSFQNLQQNTELQLAQDYASAVQSAIQLNDLEIQRQQSEISFQEQYRNIMNSGVLVRSQTLAQTKAIQIAQLQMQQDLQEQQLDQQIDLTQQQVDAASKVFNLATTRIGLEQQLLQQQAVGVNYDMLRIQALQQVVAGIQQLQSGYGLTPALAQALNLPALEQLLQSLYPFTPVLPPQLGGGGTTTPSPTSNQPTPTPIKPVLPHVGPRLAATGVSQYDIQNQVNAYSNLQGRMGKYSG